MGEFMRGFNPKRAELAGVDFLFHIMALSELRLLCCSSATKHDGQPTFRANCFALPRPLWCNSDNFPKGGWPGVRWERKVHKHSEPFAPEPYV